MKTPKDDDGGDGDDGNGDNHWCGNNCSTEVPLFDTCPCLDPMALSHWSTEGNLLQLGATAKVRIPRECNFRGKSRAKKIGTEGQIAPSKGAGGWEIRPS